MQRALGLRLSFGKGMLAFGMFLAVAAVGAAVVSLLGENDWLQLAPLATIMVAAPMGLYLRSRRTANLSPEITVQVVLSVGIYGIVWGAACGYALATFLGPSVGTARTAVFFYGVGIGLLLAFSLILVRLALRSRERYYCLGLAISTLLAGMLLPILDRHYSYPLAHCFMAIGYLTGVAIQWVQLREAVAKHGAD
jgi:carbon starvation protein CstA